MKGKRILLATAVSAACHQTAWSQEPATVEDDVEIIEVTAQNRVQSIADVPISMNVLGGEWLKDNATSDLHGISKLSPDFSITQDTISTKVSLRGITTESADETQDQSLAVSIDGEYLNRPRVLNAALFDISRIEVLRGPQGTLFGRNATGGALSIISNKPVFGEWSGSASADFGSFNARELNAVLNAPVGDNAAVRFAGFSSDRDGYISHPDVSFKSGDKEVKAARLSFAAEPTERLSLYLALETSQQENNPVSAASFNDATEGQSDLNGQCNEAAGWIEVTQIEGNVLCSPQFTNNKDAIDPRNYPAATTAEMGSYQLEGDAVRGQLDYAADAFTVSYRGAFRQSELRAAETLFPSYLFYRNHDIDTMSNELRLSGGEGDFFWQGGIFQFREEMNIYSGLLSYIGAYPFGPQGYWANTFYRPDYTSESVAAFGQVEYPLADNYTVIAGFRYTKDEKTGTNTILPGALTFDENPTLRPKETEGATTELLSAKNNEFTWNLGLNTDISDNTMLYGKVSKGYKAGGFDSTGLEYAPEILYAWEIGTKSRISAVSFDASAFYYDYKDLQVSLLLDTEKGAQTFNAGKATIWGAEASLTTEIMDAGVLALTANYLNAEFDDFASAISVQCLGGCSTTTVTVIDGETVNLAGNEPSNSPDWIFTGSYTHFWELSNGSLVGNIFTRWKDDYYLLPSNHEDARQESYFQTDISLKYVSPSEQWEVQGYVRNLEDNYVLSSYVFNVAGPDDVQQWSWQLPRTAGVKVTYKFY